MSHIHVRKIIGDRYHFAGKEWWYAFGPEVEAFDMERVKRFIAKNEATFSRLAKAWNGQSNTEWVCRIFWAAKMILAASVMLENLAYARRKNLKICVPYLQYYSLLYSLKALVVVLPSQRWDNGALIEQKHAKTINVACDEITKLDRRWQREKDGCTSVKRRILRLKAFREFISYRAPSSGGSLEEYGIDVVPLCRVPVELSQMISEVLERSLLKQLPDGYKPELLDGGLANVFSANIDGEHFFDAEDRYRIGYLFRKYPMPTNILHVMSEGHVEDFFGSWCGEKEDESADQDIFDPDDNWRILFDVP